MGIKSDGRVTDTLTTLCETDQLTLTCQNQIGVTTMDQITIYAQPLYEDGSQGGDERELVVSLESHADIGRFVAESAANWIGKTADQIDPGNDDELCDAVDISVTIRREAS